MNAQLRSMDGEEDHVHLLIDYPPTIRLSEMVNALKGASNRALRKSRPQLKREWGLKNRLWSPNNFAASCAGAPLSVISLALPAVSVTHISWAMASASMDS